LKRHPFAERSGAKDKVESRFPAPKKFRLQTACFSKKKIHQVELVDFF